MNVRIEIDTRTFVRFWLVVIGFALAALVIYSARTALIIVGISFFLAIALSPPVNRLAKILPSKSRVLSTAIAYMAVLSFLGAVIFLVVPPIIEQTVKFAQNFPSLVDSASQQYTGASNLINHYNLQPEVDKIITSIKNGATRFAAGAGSFLITSIGSVLFTIFTTILVLVLTFLMLVEGPTWLRRLWSVYNDEERMEYHRKLLFRMYKVVTGFVVGQLSISSIAGTVAGISVFIINLTFGAPTNLAIPAAAIIFTLSLIPLFGEPIAAVLVAVILALNNVSAAVVFLIFSILYQQLEGNYISPKIQSKRTDLSALVVLIAVTTGVYLFGIAGGLISIPIAGCIGVLVEDYFTRSKRKFRENEKSLDRSLKEAEIQKA